MKGQTLKEKTASGLLWGALNNMTVQLMSALIGIVLSRLLLPADYGMVGMLTIFTAIAGSLQESGFTSALCNLREASHDDFNSVFWFSSLMSAILYALLCLCAPLIASYFRHPELVSLSYLVFGSLFLAGVGTAHAAWLFRNMMNREKAIINAVAMTISGIVGIALAFAGKGYWSLAWQQFSYMLITNIMRLYYVRWVPTLPVSLEPVKRMFGFSCKMMVTNIINQVNSNVLSLIFGRLFSAASVGNYTQAQKWNTMGTSFISGTIQQVAQPVLVRVGDEGNRQVGVFRKMLRFTVFLSMPAMLGLAFIAGEFIPLLLGDQWHDSVPILQMLCVGGAFMPIQTLYQNLFISHGRSDTYMWCTIAQIVLQTTVILAFGRWGIHTMVGAYTCLIVVWTGVWQCLGHRLIGLRHIDVAKDIVPFVLAAVGCIVAAHFATLAIHGRLALLVAKVVIVALLYILVMQVARVKIYKECVAYFFDKIKKR